MTAQLQTVSEAKIAEKISTADQELAALNAKYAELAADAALTAGSMLPPPAGTAADLASLGKSLATGDYVGSLFDLIGVIPIAGDAIKAVGKGTKVVNKLNDLRKAIDAATAGLTRIKRTLKSAKPDDIAKILDESGDLLEVRKAAAKAYWDDVIKNGRKTYDEAVANCSTQKCVDNLPISLKGDHYKYTPVNKGSWKNGTRGDGDWFPDANSKAGKAITEFNKKFKKQVEHIPYKDGHPDFSELVVPTKKGPAQVEIKQIGDNDLDFQAADEVLKKVTGYTERELEQLYGIKLTWHHAPDGTTMQLVPTKAHGGSNGVGHAGGGSLIRNPEY
ncbi:MAG: HNH endonuclease [Desulfobacterales bacterium]|nr:HNH endonuclease [Desulfobacterales bacterium]